MTTIAYHHKDRQIAVDSRVTSGDEILSDTENKAYKNELGIWLGSGNSCDYDMLFELKHKDECYDKLDCDALVIVKGKVYHVAIDEDTHCCCWTEAHYNYTLGTGEAYAMSAMDFGKSAKEAVEYAKTKDTNTGGLVRCYNLKKVRS